MKLQDTYAIVTEILLTVNRDLRDTTARVLLGARSLSCTFHNISRTLYSYMYLQMKIFR